MACPHLALLFLPDLALSYMIIQLLPVNDESRKTVLALSVREDQPFVATNDVSLRQTDETAALHQSENPSREAADFLLCKSDDSFMKSRDYRQKY